MSRTDSRVAFREDPHSSSGISRSPPTLNLELNNGQQVSYLLPHKKLSGMADLVCLSMH